MRVQLRDVEVRFGAVEALRGVSVALEPGQVSVLVGPNGAGKSTLMAVLLGLVEPDGGSVEVDGVDLLGAGRRARRRFRERLGYLPEAVAFAENLSGRQVLRFFARARGVPRARVEELLEQVGLAAAAGRATRGYSRGMLQRLGLAVAQLARPELLVLDEPTGGLDQEGLRLLWDLMAARSAEGKTTVVSTHDLALIERRADRVEVLSDGRLLASGPPEELRRLARLPVRVRLELEDMRRAEPLAGRLSRDFSVPVSIEEDAVRLSVPEEALFAVVRSVDAEGCRVAHLRVEEPGLDDIYEALLDERGGA